MVPTIQHIATDITESYARSLSNEEKIDSFLDQINNRKKEYRDLTDQLVHLSQLFSQITWLDDLTPADKVLIKGVITMGKEADVELKKFYASQSRLFGPKGLFNKELSELKTAVEDHIENVLEVEHIIFELRDDKEFKELSKLIDEL